VVERLLAKEKATSSNLVARSKKTAGISLPHLFTATWPSGKAGVCKTLITGSNPVVALVQDPCYLQGFFVFLVKNVV
jgi:hypothetical protein